MFALIALVLCGILLFLFIVLWTKERQRRQLLIDLHNRQLEERAQQLQRMQEEQIRLQEERLAMQGRCATAIARQEELQRLLDNQKTETLSLQEKFRTEFENLANRLLEQKSEKFTRQNQQNLEALLKPLQERIRDFEKKVDETYDKESKERFSLTKELQRLYELNQTLSQDAHNLTNALKADTKKQGSWGEILLERILEASGLQSGVHYLRQESRIDESGSRRQPDVTILLPENRHVIVDAKVSLTAYERYFASMATDEQQRALKEHLLSVRRHVDELSGKSYERLHEHSPDFVLMFIPVEPAYGLALMQDSQLFEYAFRKKVILVSVSSLLATLRIIDSMWRLENQNRNAAEIVKQGSDLYDKFVGFVEDLQSIGRSISQTQKTYEQAMGKLSEGRGNLIGKAERMRRLGLNNRRQLSGEWKEESDDETPFSE